VKVKTSRNVVDQFPVFVSFGLVLVSFDSFPTDFLKGFAVNFRCVSEVTFAEHGSVIFLANVGIFTYNLGYITELLLHFLPNFLVTCLYIKFVGTRWVLEHLLLRALGQLVHGLVTLPLSPDQAAAINLIGCSETPPRPCLEDTLNQQTIVSFAYIKLV
jgi:hypothetical protein